MKILHWIYFQQRPHPAAFMCNHHAAHCCYQGIAKVTYDLNAMLLNTQPQKIFTNTFVGVHCIFHSVMIPWYIGTFFTFHCYHNAFNFFVCPYQSFRYGKASFGLFSGQRDTLFYSVYHCFIYMQLVPGWTNCRTFWFRVNVWTPVYSTIADPPSCFK